MLPKSCVAGEGGGGGLPKLTLTSFILGAKTKGENVAQIACWGKFGQCQEKVFFLGGVPLHM